MTEDISGGALEKKGKVNIICEALKEELQKINE
jgi:hypothetical protein